MRAAREGVAGTVGSGGLHKYWRSNMFVERPVYSLEPTLMATSVVALIDSAGWLLEAAPYHFADAREVWVSDNTFRAAVSEPFERTVLSTLREAGWRVGTISATGTLFMERTPPRSLGAGCPGEVDAVATDGRRTWVIECKCLQLPFLVPGRLREMVARLGPTDDKAYHRKAADKARWLNAIAGSAGLGEDVRPLLVLDRPLPGMLDGGPVPIVAHDTLLHFVGNPDASDSRFPLALRERWDPSAA